jgi:hypothetical protein
MHPSFEIEGGFHKIKNLDAMLFKSYRICYLCSVFTLIILIAAPAIAGVVQSVDEQTALVSWKIDDGNFELELAQLLPDQTRAFFLARGFSKQIANTIATGCIMQTIGRNSGGQGMPGSIDVDLKQWRMLHDGSEGPIKLKEQWDSEWPADKVSDTARLAFRWATFPTQQNFAPGDYGWGMTSFALPPGRHFDLKVVWSVAGVEKDAWIRGVQCAEER